MIDSQNEFLLSNPIRLSDPSALELKAGVSAEILKWHSNSLSLIAEFESFSCDLLASIDLVNKNGCKGSIKTKAMTIQNPQINFYLIKKTPTSDR